MKTLLHILVFLTSLCLASASNISYFSTPEITFSTPSGRPGSSNLNNVYFNITDASTRASTDCHYSWPTTSAAPNRTAPAACADSSFSWHFGADPVVDDFDVVVRHRVGARGWVHGLSPRYKVGGPGASYECGGSGACSFTVEGGEDGPLKIYFD